MIYSWNRPGVIVNQVDFVGNRVAGAFVARFIKQYQDLYPGRPVHIIGHSGGGGVAVFTAESMGNDGKIDRLILLAASISKNYNLTKALRNTAHGIVNFYNPSDTALLGAGTTLMGTVDGDHAPAAGLNGFERSFPGLIERRVSGGGDPHYVATKPWFVAGNVAPLLGPPATPTDFPATPTAGAMGR
jgi:pimeloyl-ACP methyl ester carboxylesterase